MLIVQSQSLDVYHNLAIEEYLMDHVVDHGAILFLWRSDCAIVIGKNQNPWRECRLDLMERDEVPLARRISGGGTVYHDTGNLNYCVITDRTKYHEKQAYDMVLQALHSLGVQAERSGKSNLSVNGFKFSGNAFCFRKGRAMHHGTLLLNTDMERLNRYLGSMFNEIDTHAIRSVPAKVANLDIELHEVTIALEKSFLSHYDSGDIVRWEEAQLDPAVFKTVITRQISDEWKWGATPKFILNKNGVVLEVSKGMVTNAQGGCVTEFEGKAFTEIARLLVCSD